MELELEPEEDRTQVARETGADDASGFDYDGRPLLYWTERQTLLCADCVTDLGAPVVAAVVRGVGARGRCDACGEVDDGREAPSCGSVARALLSRVRGAPCLAGEPAPLSATLFDDVPDGPRGIVVKVGGASFWCTVERLL